MVVSHSASRLKFDRCTKNRHDRRASSFRAAIACSLHAAPIPLGATPQHRTPSEAVEDILQGFSSAVSGEWAGFSFDCSSDGRPVELPASLTPQAFRDWGQQLFGWETLTSTRADATGENVSFLKSKVRFQPAAGCDASCPPPQTKDRQQNTFSASNPTINPVDASDTGGDKSTLFYSSEGAYVSVGWREGGEVDIEHCFILPSLQSLSSLASIEGPASPAFTGVRPGDKVRLRVTQRLRVETLNGSNDQTIASVILRGVTVAKERWISPYVGLGEFEEGGLAVARFEEEGEGCEEEREERERQWRERLTANRWQVWQEISSSETKAQMGVGVASPLLPSIPATAPVKEAASLLPASATILPQELWCHASVEAPPSGSPAALKAESGWLIHPQVALLSRVQLSTSSVIDVSMGLLNC